ncbi:MAG: efflux RND transporter periplasmic adaptor subunit [Halofilum sp. (in: g-proteobacteria)]|nr:efflux RND transporter periplasmic adaptor subunit [Halofilum sp. (in: g-proteobacteria)]
MRIIAAVLPMLLAAAVAAAELPTAPARLAPVTDEQLLDGVVEAVNRSTVSAQTTGRVVALPFDVDDYVEQGEVIVRLRDNEQQARLERARANLEEARARLAQARAEYERIREVFEQDLVSRSEMDRARAEYESARARVEAARAALEEARQQLEHTVVRAPYAGIVVERHIELGETASVGQPLMTGLSLEHLRVLVQVPQQHITALREHQAARVLLPGGASIEAQSLRIFPYADEATHTFRVRVTLPEGRHGIYPGMLVKTAFVRGQTERLLVPGSAVVHRSEVTAVYVRGDDGRLEFRQVRVGTPLADGRVPVLAGLDAGETVVTDPVAAAVALKERPTGNRR